MGYYLHALLVLKCFNVVTFATLGLLSFREWRTRRHTWGGGLFTLLCFDCSLTLLLDLVITFVGQAQNGFPPLLLIADAASKFALAPMLLHVFCNAERRQATLSRWWNAGVAALYGAAAAASVAVAWSYAGSAREWKAHWTDVLFVVLMLASAGGTALIFRRGWCRATTRPQRSQYRWLAASLGILALAIVGENVTKDVGFEALLLAAPPLFAFVLVYYVRRFAFFDIFVKRLTFFFVTLGVISAYFVLVPPWIRAVKWGRFSLLAWSMSVWPIVIVVPWAYARLSAWMDRTFLGRRLSPAEAGRAFLTDLKGAISEREIVEAAESSLQRIFGCEAHIRLNGASDPGWPPGLEMPFQAGEKGRGAVWLRERLNHGPFLSEDVALLSSLAASFAFMLDNVRLRERRLDQERREQELLLLASRSELKALRAEINPHFLFNALSAIAALIRPAPDRAEATVEQLAEIFRYTLRRSEKEWVRFGEELEFVRAYLDVEQARFGDRLRVSITVDPDAHARWMPAMVLQVIVENAVKHGVASVRGQGVVEISARTAGDRLTIEVRDNGPGFTAAANHPQGAGAGYGLRNIHERLQGYFGDSAALRFGRRDGMTVATVELPACTAREESATV